MIGLVRAAALCATLALGLVVGAGRGQGLQARRSRRFRDQAGGPDQERGGAGRQDQPRRLRTDADAAFRRNDFRTGLQILGQIAATTPEDSGNWLRLARTIFQITPSDLERADLPAGARLDRGLHRLSARRQSGRRRPMRSPCSAASLSERKLWRPALDALRLSLDLREVADVRGQYEKLRDEHGFRLLDYTVDSDSASPARLLPVLRGPGQAHRLRAVPGAGRQRQAGAVGRRQAALRRRAEARRALQHQSARRPAVHREGRPAEIGRVQHLCPRPQAVRALHRPRLCAAAHRPARHSRWSASTRRRSTSTCSGSATAT